MTPLSQPKKVRKNVCFLAVFLLFYTFSAQSQTAFDPYNFNEKFLEHLIKVRIDSVRKVYLCSSLYNDSILYVASKHHSRYMDSTGIFLHEEPGNLNTLTPQKRAEYYGAKDYNVGENIIIEHFKATYEDIADSIVDGWVHSKRHFDNMINCKYQITGVSVKMNLESNMIYACQKFASISSATTFVENTNFFPTEFNILNINSFGDKPHELIKNPNYEYGLKHDKPEKCELCQNLVYYKPFINLKHNKNKDVTLRIENSEYVQQLLNNRKDGFAIEIVIYDDYLCDNPIYYSKSSRRNGERKLNGIITKPKYKFELQSGFKKRNKKKSVKFVDYIFKSAAEGDYDFSIETKQIKDEVEFKKNEYTFSEKDLIQFTNQKDGWQIDSIQIVAFSSVEGDSLKNYELQQLRAQSIADIIGKSQKNHIKTTISSKTDWEGFYKAIKTNPNWSHLSNKSHAELIEYFNKNGSAEFEKILSKQRRGLVTVYYSKPCNKENVAYYIKTEANRLKTSLNNKVKKDKKLASEDYEQFTKLYTYAHRAVLEKIIKPSILANIEMPANYITNSELAQKFVLYGLEFEAEFSDKKDWKERHEQDISQLSKKEFSLLTDPFNYFLARREVEKHRNIAPKNINRFEEIVEILNQMKPIYANDSITRTQIDRLNVNANYMLLFYLLKSDPQANSKTAIQSISQIYEYYKKNNGLSAEKLISLAKMAIYYDNTEHGLNMMAPVKAINDSIYAYYMSVKYVNIEDPGSDLYYLELLRLNKTMDRNIWCNMFINKCGIPFQAFDYEPLRKVFCEQCLDINRTIIDLHKKDIIH
ncbi:MAG: CAP domain-containing protein [Cryomorphaceae bacterium]|nr:CAP domain-containing protein [Cryomorphaceae bacterium]